MTTENKPSIFGESHTFDMSTYEPSAGKTVSHLHQLVKNQKQADDYAALSLTKSEIAKISISSKQIR